MTRVVAPTPDAIRDAAAMIRAGQLVAFPTETVYGLGADATNGEAVARIFAAKGRPSFNPLISHGFSIDMVAGEALFDERALALADRFWPGPLTMILPRSPKGRISDLACAGLPTVALRVPDHPVARALIETAGVPIAAPSANASGTISPTLPHHVLESIGDAVPLILAGGATRVGLESTVVDLTGPDVAVLRAGGVSAEEIGDCLGISVGYELSPSEKPRSPGQLLRHYAPRIPVRLNAVDIEPDEALLAFGSVRFMGIRGGGKAADLPESRLRNLSEKADLCEAAANLFAYLRALDVPNNKRIAVMNIPDTGIGIAINERLKRAENSAK